MTHYIAIVEDAGPDKAAGLWFPDLPGCFSAGEDLDEALRNAEEAVALFADALAGQGKTLPAPRPLTVLSRDPLVAADLRDHVVALVPFRRGRFEAA